MMRHGARSIVHQRKITRNKYSPIEIHLLETDFRSKKSIGDSNWAHDKK